MSSALRVHTGTESAGVEDGSCGTFELKRVVAREDLGEGVEGEAAVLHSTNKQRKVSMSALMRAPSLTRPVVAAAEEHPKDELEEYLTLPEDEEMDADLDLLAWWKGRSKARTRPPMCACTCMHICTQEHMHMYAYAVAEVAADGTAVPRGAGLLRRCRASLFAVHQDSDGLAREHQGHLAPAHDSGCAQQLAGSKLFFVIKTTKNLL